MSVVLMNHPALLVTICIGQNIDQETKDDNSGYLQRGEIHSGKILMLLIKMLSALVQVARILK